MKGFLFSVAAAVSAAFLCACTISIAPIKKQTYRYNPRKSTPVVAGIGDPGTVSASWMLRYRELEHHYGEIDADRDITATKGRFILPPGTQEHFNDMIRWQNSSF